MKAKKEYVILVVIIIAGWSYLIFHKDDRIQYKLPIIPQIEIDAITNLRISAGGKTINLEKKEKEWLITPKNYPADGAKIKSMLFQIEDIEITDLVSESKAYDRYQLDAENKISVKAWAGDKLLREFDVGKEAATFQHTFFRLPESSYVYHARGDFRRKFGLSAAELRDQEVLAFDPDTLKRIQVSIGSDTLEMTKKVTQTEEKLGPGKEGDTPVGGTETVWLSSEGQKVDSNTLDSFLSSINNLMCEKYLEGRQKNEFKNPSFKISLEGKQAYTLSIFQKTTDKKKGIPAISSLNAYPFTLSSDKLENLIKMTASLKGKKVPSKNDELP
jgi:hypothetical protein